MDISEQEIADYFADEKNKSRFVSQERVKIEYVELGMKQLADDVTIDEAALKQQYDGKEVPDKVADVAARVAIAGSDAELRAIAASLLINTQGDQTQSEHQLIAALKRHPEDYDMYSAIVDFYGPDRRAIR